MEPPFCALYTRLAAAVVSGLPPADGASAREEGAAASGTCGARAAGSRECGECFRCVLLFSWRAEFFSSDEWRGGEARDEGLEGQDDRRPAARRARWRVRQKSHFLSAAGISHVWNVNLSPRPPPATPPLFRCSAARGCLASSSSRHAGGDKRLLCWIFSFSRGH